MNIFEYVLCLPFFASFFEQYLYLAFLWFFRLYVFVSSLYIHLIQKNLTYFLPKKLCTRSRRTLFHCSWQYLLNTCLHSNKLMTGYITETFSFCASSLHWVHQPTAFYPILLQKWLLGKIQGYIQLKYVQKKKWI